jgi:hypothetical protein
MLHLILYCHIVLLSFRAIYQYDDAYNVKDYFYKLYTTL